MNSLMDSDTHIDAETGEIQAKITYDYIIDLYQDLETQKLTKKERQSRLAVLQVLIDHIGEYIIIKQK